MINNTPLLVNVINDIISQLVGPVLGGVLHEVGGFFFPFVVMGALQVVLALSRYYTAVNCIIALFWLVNSVSVPSSDWLTILLQHPDHAPALHHRG